MPRAVTTTSSTATLSSCRTTSTDVLPASGTTWAFIPMKETCRVAFGSETDREKCPFESVVVPRVVPSWMTVAPTIGCLVAFVTTPVTVTLCWAAAGKQQRADRIRAESHPTDLPQIFVCNSFSISFELRSWLICQIPNSGREGSAAESAAGCACRE